MITEKTFFKCKGLLRPTKPKVRILAIFLMLNVGLIFIVDGCSGFYTTISLFHNVLKEDVIPSYCPDVIQISFFGIFLLFCAVPIAISRTFLNFISIKSEFIFIIITLLIFIIFYYIIISIILNLKKKRLNNKNPAKGKKIMLVLLIFLFNFNFAQGISDSNQSNNNATVMVNIITTNNLSFLIEPIKGPLADFNFDSYEEDIGTQLEFFYEIFPVTNNTLSYKVTTKTLSTIGQADLALLNFALETAIEGKLSSYNRFIGVYNSGFLSAEGYHKSSSGFLNNFVLVKDNQRIAMAHELGHSYALCDEYYGNDYAYDFTDQDGNKLVADGGCPNHDLDENGILDSDDCTNTYCEVSDSNLIYTLNLYDFPWSSGKIKNVMGDVVGENVWIDQQNYNHLLDEFQNYSYLYDAIEVYIIPISLNRITGNVSFGNFYSADGGYLTSQDDLISGNYSFELRNQNGTIERSFLFNPTYTLRLLDGSEEELNETHLIFIVPVENITNFTISLSSSSKAQKSASEHIPKLTLISPNGGQTFINLFNISWNASDLDNDTLAYAVLISDDNGSTWSTLAYDLNTTFYEVSNAWFSYGTDYKIKVLATDSVNTGSDVSDSNFTIIPPPSVAVNSIEEVYSNQSRKIYEVVIENDGGQTLSNLSWRFNTGLANITNNYNVTLVQNEQLELLFDINYTSGGWMNVSLFAYDNNKSVNDSLTELFFVGDLAVGGLKQLYSNSTQRTFEFIISNQGSYNLTNADWTVRTGNNNNFSSSTAINLSPYESAFVLFEYNFSDTGSYNMTVNVSDDFNPYETSLDLLIPDIAINDFRIINQSDNIINFSFGIENLLNKNINASYVLNTGTQNLTNNSIILTPGQEINFTRQANYTSYGNFTATINASDNYKHSKKESTSVSVNELDVTNLQKLYSSGTSAMFEFIVKNLFSINKTFTWSLNTNDTAGIIWSNQQTTLTPNENTTIMIQNNFSSTGTYHLTAKANTTSANYTESLNITLS